VVEQPSPQRRGAQRHHHIVDGETQCRLDRLDLGQRHGSERVAPVRGEGTVERGTGSRGCPRGQVRRARQVGQAPHPARGRTEQARTGNAAGTGQLQQVRNHRGGGPQQLGGAAEQVPHTLAQQCRGTGGRPRCRSGGCGCRAGPGVEVHEHGQHLGAGDPVDHRVVHLHVQRLTSTGHTMDQVALPQRVLAAQRGLGQSGHLLGELFIGAGCGQTDLPDVMLQVRCRRVHPVGQVEPQGHLPQTPAQRFDQVQAAADQRADLLHREATAGCSGGIEDGHDAHVGRHRRGFRVEELGI